MRIRICVKANYWLDIKFTLNVKRIDSPDIEKIQRHCFQLEVVQILGPRQPVTANHKTISIDQSQHPILTGARLFDPSADRFFVKREGGRAECSLIIIF